MMNLQCIVKTKSFTYPCLRILFLVMTTTAFGHAQTKQISGRGTLNQQEYAISGGGAVWRVGAGGSLYNYDPGGKATSSFYHYAYSPTLLQVSSESPIVCAGAQQFLTRDATGRIFIEAYRISPQGQFKLTNTFANEPSGDMPYALTFSGGRFLYVLTLRGAITKRPFSTLSSYRVSRGGYITRLSVSETQISVAGFNQLSMISDPQGRFIYITRPQSRTVDVYRVTTKGTLKALPPSPLSLPKTPSQLLCPLGGPFLYAVSRNDNSLTQLRRNKDGTLHVVHFFRFGNVNPKRAVDPVLAISPNGRFLYVGDETQPDTQQYGIQPDGRIKPLFPPTAAFSPDSIAVDLTNRFAYLTGSGFTNQKLIHPYRISPSGTLIRIKGNPVATAGNVSLTFIRLR